jgi:predicted transcriptional regulator
VRYLRFMDEDRDLAILAEEDDATLLAIDEGIQSADAGRLIPIEEVERLVPEWISKYSTPPKR